MLIKYRMQTYMIYLKRLRFRSISLINSKRMPNPASDLYFL